MEIHRPLDAQVDDHLGGTLAIDAVLAVGKLHACAHALAGRREGELLAAILRMYVHVYLYLYGHDNNIAGTFRRADALLQGSSGEGANDWQRT
jgi:hypothetical protein